MADAGCNEVRSRALNFVPVEPQFHGVRLEQAGEGFNELRLAVAVDAGHAQNLAAMEGKRDVLENGNPVFAVRQMLHGEERLTDCLGGMAALKTVFTAHHHAGQLLHGGFVLIHAADELAVPENGAPVGNLHDLIELVGNDDDALPFRA